jgi:hypothetical protein
VPSNLPIDGHSFRRVEVLTGAPRGGDAGMRRRSSDCHGGPVTGDRLATPVSLRRGAEAGLVACDFVPVVAENQGGPSTAAVEIQIRGATLRVGAEG